MAFRPLKFPGFSAAFHPEMKPLTAATVLEYGELVKFTATGVVVTAGAASITGVDILGVAAMASTATDTFTEIEVYINPMIIYEVGISEIVNATTLTATGGSGTTIEDTSFLPGEDDLMIGSVLEVVTCASGDSSAGDLLTVTDFNNTGGVFTFASVGSTGFANADTYKLVSVGNNLLGAYSLESDGDGVYIVLNKTGAGDFCKVVGISDDKKKLEVMLTSSLYGSSSTVST